MCPASTATTATAATAAAAAAAESAAHGELQLELHRADVQLHEHEQ